MIYIVLIISFLFEGFISTLLHPNSLLFPLFSLMSIIVIYPFFKKDEYSKYLVICAFLGLLYDIVYTNTFLLNMGLFLLFGIITKFIFEVFSSNLISTTLTGLLFIFLYRIITYLILIISGYLQFSFFDLLKGIYSSLIINIIYIIIIYGIIKVIENKFKLRRFS